MQLENTIYNHIVQKKNELFGQGSIELGEKSAEYKKVTTYVEGLLEDFPLAEDGNRYMRCRFHLAPKLVVREADFSEIIEGKQLFAHIVGKRVADIAPLHHPVFGAITTDTRTLELKNILWPHQMPQQALPTRPSCLQSNVMMYGINLNLGDTQRTKCSIVAAMQFGTFKPPVHQIEVIQDRETVAYSIPLPLSAGTISCEGEVKLSNKPSFNISQLQGIPRGTFIDTTFTYTTYLNAKEGLDLLEPSYNALLERFSSLCISCNVTV